MGNKTNGQSDSTDIKITNVANGRQRITLTMSSMSGEKQHRRFDLNAGDRVVISTHGVNIAHGDSANVSKTSTLDELEQEIYRGVVNSVNDGNSTLNTVTIDLDEALPATVTSTTSFHLTRSQTMRRIMNSRNTWAVLTPSWGFRNPTQAEVRHQRHAIVER